MDFSLPVFSEGLDSINSTTFVLAVSENKREHVLIDLCLGWQFHSFILFSSKILINNVSYVSCKKTVTFKVKE